MAGFSFYIGDDYLYLGDKTKISVSIESILLSDKTIAGAISFPFNIPNTAHNRMLLNISNTLMSFDEYQNVKCKCFLGGNFWKAGYILINNHDPKTINITYTEFNSEEDFNTKTLQDLPFKKIDSTGEFYNDTTTALSQLHVDLIARANETYPEKDFVCPNVFNIKTLDVNINLGYQNFFADGRYLPDYYNSLNSNAISPFLYLNYIMQFLFKNIGLNINKNKLSESDLQKLIVYTNKVNVLYTDYKQTPGTQFFAVFSENEIDLAKFVPDMSFTTFLTAVKSTFNLVYLINNIENKVDILNKNEIIKTAKIVDISTVSEPFQTITYNKDFKKITSISYEKSEDIILTDDSNRFTLKGYQYKGFINNIGDIPNIAHQVNDYYILRLLTNTYADAHSIVFYDTTGSWNTSLITKAKNNRPYNVYFSNENKNEKDFKLNIDTTITRINQGFYTTPHGDGTVTVEPFNKYKFYCPAVDIAIASNKNHSFYVNETNTKTDTDVTKNLRLLFYRGMRQEMKHGGTFPFANRNEFDFTTSPSLLNDDLEFFDSFEHSLEIDGPKGLWEKFHREWQEFIATLSRLVTYSVRFSPAQIISDDLFLNYMQINGKRFIISKITITGDTNKIEPCKTEMYQIEPK